jgi:hypothetical protein
MAVRDILLYLSSKPPAQEKIGCGNSIGTREADGRSRTLLAHPGGSGWQRHR